MFFYYYYNLLIKEKKFLWFNWKPWFLLQFLKKEVSNLNFCKKKKIKVFFWNGKAWNWEFPCENNIFLFWKGFWRKRVPFKKKKEGIRKFHSFLLKKGLFWKSFCKDTNFEKTKKKKKKKRERILGKVDLKVSWVFLLKKEGLD